MSTFAFTPGAAEVIPGFEQGVLGMKVGGRRQILVPPALGYGLNGYAAVPGNAVLVFTIDAASIP